MPTCWARRARRLMSSWSCWSSASIPARKVSSGGLSADGVARRRGRLLRVAVIDCSGRSLGSLSLARVSAVTMGEILHESHQRVDPLGRHGVVEAGANAAHGTVALEVQQPGAGSLVNELLVQAGTRQREGHVHPRAAPGRHLVAVEAGGVDRPVEALGLGAIALGHAR